MGPAKMSSVTVPPSAKANLSDQVEPGTLSQIMTAIGQASYIWDIADDRINWSENFYNLVGFQSGIEIDQGRAFEKLLSADSQETRFGAVFSHAVTDVPENGIAYQCIYAVNAEHLKNNVSVWLEDTGRWYADTTGKPIRAEGMVRVINERRQREETLKRKSDYDDLTGLPNRRYLEERIDQVAATGIAESKSSAFMMVSICDFERVNNIYGFAAGDEVLAQISGMLAKHMRNDDLVARFSGAKFGIVLNNCNGGEIFVAAKRVIDCLHNQLLQTSKGPVSIKAAIGACLLPRHARKAKDAIAASMQALNQARRERGLRANIYDPNPAHVEKQQSDAELVGRFVTALETSDMHLAYQPVVSSDTQRPVFYEALLRMKTINSEKVEDAGFIRMAEDLGLMRLVDNHALQLALETLAKYPTAKISLNITHESSEDPEWISTLASGVQDIECGAQRLIIELTESQLPLDIEETRKFVQLLHDIGCQVAIDDFGAGYTSFANLKDLEVDIVKIDGSFCRGLKLDSRNGAFLKSLQQLASAFDVKTVVEWVEDVETATLMKEWGFDLLQGSAFGMPLAVAPWEKPENKNLEKENRSA